jgi:pimeloyl-ACP methyl ester carboxylesterase
VQTFRETRARAGSRLGPLREVRKRFLVIASCLMFMVTFSFARPADGLLLSQAAQSNEFSASSAGPVNSVAKEGAISTAVPQGSAKESSGNGISQLIPRSKLIVIGFLGGKVRAGNLVHREAQLIKTLQLGYPLAIRAEIFANSDGNAALRAILEFLDEDGDGRLSDEEKKSARIVLFGHSWGASQTITLAKRLNKLQIPVLLTIQVDSVRKLRQNDGDIPPNVLEAVNFYQSEGLLRGRKVIVAMDPAKTKILGNHESSYRQNPVSCAGFPWYARAFMRRHIEIENDPAVWNQIEELILFRAR